MTDRLDLTSMTAEEALEKLLALQPLTPGELSDMIRVYDQSFYELNDMFIDMEKFKSKSPESPKISKLEERFWKLKEANEMFRKQYFALQYYHNKYINAEIKLLETRYELKKLRDKYDRITGLKKALDC